MVSYMRLVVSLYDYIRLYDYIWGLHRNIPFESFVKILFCFFFSFPLKRNYQIQFFITKLMLLRQSDNFVMKHVFCIALV